MPKRRKKLTRAIKMVAKKCAYPGCNNPVEDNDLCYGCKSYTCNEHSVNDPWGQHDPKAHWQDNHSEVAMT